MNRVGREFVYQGNEAVTFSGDGLYKAGTLGIVSQRLADLANSGVDTALHISRVIRVPNP
jgi:hypothetical protein